MPAVAPIAVRHGLGGTGPLSRNRALFLIILVALPAFFLGLGRRALWNPVEPRYAGISAEMLESSSWLVPTYNSRSYDQKPAFYFWLGATSLSLSDNPDHRLFLVRLPSAVGGLLLVLGTWMVALRLFDPKRALLAALVTSTCWIVFWSSRFCHMDTLLAATVTWALFFALKAKDSLSTGERWRAVALLSVALFAGVMLKGPAALVFVAVVVGAWALVAKRPRDVVASGLHVAVPLALGLAAFWFVPAWLKAGDGWAHALLFEAGVQHLFDPTNSPKHGVGYYPVAILLLLAPWSLFLPALVLSFKRRLRRAHENDRLAIKFALVWFAGIVAVLYLGTTYRSRYLIPLIPPFALLMADFLAAEFREGAPTRKVVQFGTMLVGTSVLVVGMTLIFPSQLAAVIDKPGFHDYFALMSTKSLAPRLHGVVIAACAASAIFLAQQRRFRVSLSCIIVGLSASFAGWSYHGAPAVDQLRGDHELIETVRDHLKTGRKLVAVEGYARRESTEGFFFFQLGKNLESVTEQKDSLEALRKGKPCLLLLRQRDMDRLGKELFSDWDIATNRPLGRHRVRVLLNDRLHAKGTNE